MYVPSSELGLPRPLSPQRVCHPPFPNPEPGGGGEHTRRRVRGWGSPNSDDWKKSLALCLLCEIICLPAEDGTIGYGKLKHENATAWQHEDIRAQGPRDNMTTEACQRENMLWEREMSFQSVFTPLWWEKMDNDFFVYNKRVDKILWISFYEETLLGNALLIIWIRMCVDGGLTC